LPKVDNKIDVILELVKLLNSVYKFVQDRIISIKVEIGSARPRLAANIIDVEDK